MSEFFTNKETDKQTDRRTIRQQIHRPANKENIFNIKQYKETTFEVKTVEVKDVPKTMKILYSIFNFLSNIYCKEIYY